MKTRTKTCRLLALAALAAIAGCRGDREDKPPRQFFPDMDDSPKFKAQTEAEAFADGRSMRPAVPGTVAFSRVSFDPLTHAKAPWAEHFLIERSSLLREDKAFFDGTDDKGDFLNRIPVLVTKEMILRGQERFNIYCSACHGFTANGQGMVAKRWATPVANLHDPKYSDLAQRTGKDGYIFHTIRFGVPEATPDLFPKMPGYGHAINESDAWAIVAYVRVLQAWQGGQISDVPPGERDALTQARAAWMAAHPLPPPPAPGEAGDKTLPAGGTPK